MATNLQLTKDEDGLTRCYGWIQGYTPIFIPRKSAHARRIIEHSHTQTLHGGVAATMSKVRQKYWIPKLRSLVKSVQLNGNHCKKYRVRVLTTPPTSVLPTFRTKFTEPFSVTGVYFAGLLLFKSGRNETSKAYVALFTCGSSRAVHLRLCRDMTAEEFKRGLKEFVARRGSAELIVSDNAKTFQATKKWLSTLRRNEDLFNYLATKDIEWKFKLARAPWWGGIFFERLIGIMKNTLSKAIGRALLKYEELEEVLLDVESLLNNRLLCYAGEEFGQPVISPNLLLCEQLAHFLEENSDNTDGDEVEEMTRRLRYLKKCRDNVRKRWLNEYLCTLQERINAEAKVKHEATMKGEILLLKDSTENRANWKIGRVVDPIVGKDDVTRECKILTGSGYVVERPLQLVCDLEIGGECDPDSGDGDAGEIAKRSVNRAGREGRRTARNRLVGVIANENEED